MDRPKHLIWLLLIALISLTGCEINRQENADVSGYDPAVQPQAAAITPAASPTIAAQQAAASPEPASTTIAETQPAQPAPPPDTPTTAPVQPAQPQGGTADEIEPPLPPPTSITQPQPTQPPAQPQATPTLVIEVKPAALPTPTPAPPPNIPQPAFIPRDATFGFCYRAQPGETIEVLAGKYGTSPQAINRTNDLEPPFYIKPQQTIFVPVLPGNGPNVYTVELGDTLAVIAERCKIPEKMLARVNNLQVGDPIYQPAGTVVQVIDGSSQILAQDTAVVRHLIIPIPHFPPPSRYQYPTGPIPIVPYSEPYPIKK